MWWYGRENSGGSWLPEEKKANMWDGRGNSGGSWLPAFPARIAQDPDPLDPQHLGFLDPDPEKYADPRMPI